MDQKTPTGSITICPIYGLFLASSSAITPSK